MEREGDPGGREDGDKAPAFPPEVLAGLDTEAREVMAEMIGLHREFPLWAVWLPSPGSPWTAVRLASARSPGPDLPMVWAHGDTSAQLAERMRRVDAQLAPR